jgi:hypothetical protein
VSGAATSPPAAGGIPGLAPVIPPSSAPGDACPLCGSPLHREQEWCLRCGAAARTRLAATPNWKAPLVAIAVVAALSLGVLTAALVDLAGNSTSSATVTTTTAAAAPATATPAPTAQPPASSTSVPTSTAPAGATPGAVSPGATKPGATTPASTTGATTTTTTTRSPPGFTQTGSIVPGATTPGTSLQPVHK